MKAGDKVRVKGSEFTATVVRVSGKDVTFYWVDGGGYGRHPEDDLELVEEK